MLEQRGNLYTVSFTGLVVAAETDLLTVLVPVDRVYQIYEIRIGQVTDPGDAEAEIYEWRLSRHRAGVTPGSGGSAVTPVAWSGRRSTRSLPPDWTKGNTTQLTSTSGLVVYQVPENNQTSFVFVPPTNAPVEFAAGDTFVFSLETTPADPVTLCGTLLFRDISVANPI